MSIKEKIAHQKLILDVNQNECLSVLEMKQGDKLSRFIDITLVASGELLNLKELVGAKAAKIIASMNGELRQCSEASINSDGTVTVEMSENALGEAGMLDCEIRITDSDDGVLSSALFLIRIGRSAAGKSGSIIDVLKGIVDFDMLNDEVASGITPILLTSPEIADSYENLLSNVIDNVKLVANRNQWLDLPTNAEGHTVINLRYSTNFCIKIAIGINSGEIYTRIDMITNKTVYRDWEGITDKCLKHYTGNTANLSAECERKLSNIKINGIVSASSSQWDDIPTHTGCAVLTLQYSTNYAIQAAFDIRNNRMWHRIINVSTGSVFRSWADSSGNPHIKILALGDSICYGARNSNKGFVGDLGLPYKNIGVSSATLSNLSSSYTTPVTDIPQQLKNEAESADAYDPDIIIMNGGINDYSRGVKLGVMSAVPVSTDKEAEALDRCTVIGGLEYLFYNAILHFKNAQRFFVITHKTWKANTNTYCPVTPNAAGWTQQDLHDAIVEVCNAYNVKVIDIYSDSMINSLFKQYRSAVAYNNDSSVTNTEYIDYDGVHPLAYGYKQGYEPIIRKAIGVGTST